MDARHTLGNMAFHKLPPLQDFVAARLTREFTARSAVESKADDMFADFLPNRGMSVEALVQAHKKHFKAAVAKEEHQEASEAELVDLHGMLITKGVAPVSDSIATYSQQRVGQKIAGRLTVKSWPLPRVPKRPFSMEGTVCVEFARMLFLAGG